MEEPKSWQIGRSKVFLLLVGTVDFGWGKGVLSFGFCEVSEVCQFCSLEALLVSLHPRKEEVQARLEKAIGEAVKAMRLSAFQVET